MNEDMEHIEEAIKNCIMNQGYGETAALMHVNPITIAVFTHAYHLGLSAGRNIPKHISVNEGQ